MVTKHLPTLSFNLLRMLCSKTFKKAKRVLLKIRNKSQIIVLKILEWSKQIIVKIHLIMQVIILIQSWIQKLNTNNSVNQEFCRTRKVLCRQSTRLKWKKIRFLYQKCQWSLKRFYLTTKRQLKCTAMSQKRCLMRILRAQSKLKVWNRLGPVDRQLSLKVN